MDIEMLVSIVDFSDSNDANNKMLVKWCVSAIKGENIRNQLDAIELEN